MKIHKNIKILAWFNFFSELKLYAPVFIIYLSQITGSFTLAMSIFSVATLSSAIFELPTGIFSDFIGRKKTLILGAFFAAVNSIFYAIGGSYFILFMGAIFYGLSQAFYSGNNDALLHDSLTEVKSIHLYDEYLGKTKAMFQLALALAAVLGSVIANYSFALAMWLSVIPQVFCFLLGFFIVEPKIYLEKKQADVFRHFKEALRDFLTNEKIRLLSLSSIIGDAIGEANFQFQAAFYKLVWPIWAIGIAKIISYLGATAGYYLSGKIIKKFTKIKILIISSIYSRLTNIIAVLWPTIISPVLMSSNALFYGLTNIARNALFQKEFKPHQRATMASLNSFFSSLFFSIIAVLVGYVADQLKPAKAIFIFQILAFLITWLYWKFSKISD
ncbi:MAG: MFS transporter [Microgenomates group bacterium]|nr:MFS transporter [Microgenomates group bacterium]